MADSSTTRGSKAKRAGEVLADSKMTPEERAEQLHGILDDSLRWWRKLAAKNVSKGIGAAITSYEKAVAALERVERGPGRSGVIVVAYSDDLSACDVEYSDAAE